MKRMLSRSVFTKGLLLGALMVSTSVMAQSAKPDADKGALLFEQGDLARGVIACASCHGMAGNSTLAINPKLAAQPYEYLVKQLLDFQPRQDKGATQPLRLDEQGAPSLMTALVEPLTLVDIQNIALYLAQQPLEQRAVASDSKRVELGQRLWRGGVPERNLPACAACHGLTGVGLPGQYPRLAGQFPSYIEQQLKVFRSGDRAGSVSMHGIAVRMSDEDIEAVADYAAGLR